MHAISNFCTALSAQNLNTPVEKVVEIEKNADSTTTVTAKITVENLHKTTKERFSGELQLCFFTVHIVSCKRVFNEKKYGISYNFQMLSPNSTMPRGPW